MMMMIVIIIIIIISVVSMPYALKPKTNWYTHMPKPVCEEGDVTV